MKHHGTSFKQNYKTRNKFTVGRQLVRFHRRLNESDKELAAVGQDDKVTVPLIRITEKSQRTEEINI
jgi:hypothetical protein